MFLERKLGFMEGPILSKKIYVLYFHFFSYIEYTMLYLHNISFILNLTEPHFQGNDHTFDIGNSYKIQQARSTAIQRDGGG